MSYNLTQPSWPLRADVPMTLHRRITWFSADTTQYIHNQPSKDALIRGARIGDNSWWW